MAQITAYLRALLKNWWIVLLTAVVAVAGTMFFSSLAERVFETRMKLLVVPNMTDFDGRDLIYSLDTLDKRSIVFTYVEVARSGRIRSQASQTLEFENGEMDAYQITASALPEASVIEVTGRGPERQALTELVNATGEATVDYISDTYDIYRLELLDSAPIPLRPIAPTPARDGALALILGLAVGGGLAILREELRWPSTEKRIATAHPLSILGRADFETRLLQLMAEEAPQLMVAVIRLNGVASSNLPPEHQDLALREVARRLRDELPGRDLIGWWDESSVALIMRRIVNEEEGFRRLERLQEELSAAPLELGPGGRTIDLDPRLGAVLSSEGDTPKMLRDQVNRALVEADKNGHRPSIYRREPAAEAAEEVTA